MICPHINPTLEQERVDFAGLPLITCRVEMLIDPLVEITNSIAKTDARSAKHLQQAAEKPFSL